MATMLLSTFLFFASTFSIRTNAIGLQDNRYRVFWNNDENQTPYIDVTQYNILPRNYTQVGNECSTANCKSWTQGVFPTISESNEIVNGGVPQAGNLTLHLERIQQDLPYWIPDADWNGNAVLDFEAWTTVWDYNTSPSGNWHSVRYQNYSLYLAAQQYPHYNQSQIYAIAKQQFESAATNWFVQTLKMCSSIRPNAKWGFYGLPLNLQGPCSGNGDEMQCGYSDPTQGAMYRNYSDQQIPIWKESGAIFPSIYLPPNRDDALYKAYVNNTVLEAIRCAQNGGVEANLVYPYMWQRYHNGTTLLSESDLNISVKLPYNLGAQGLVIWGADSNESSDAMWPYLETESGPIIQNVVDEVNECSKLYCNSHGKCTSLDSTTCICDAGYNGPHCQPQTVQQSFLYR